MLRCNICIFQPFCPCLGGSAAVEPDDIGSENQDVREEWMDFMTKCVNKASGKNFYDDSNICSVLTMGLAQNLSTPQFPSCDFYLLGVRASWQVLGESLVLV